MSEKIPYKPGTKSYIVSQKIMQGENTDKIVKDLRIKRKTVHNVRSKLKKEGLLNDPSETNVPSESSPSASELLEPNVFKEFIKGTEEQASSQKNVPEDSLGDSLREREEAIVEVKGFPVGQRIYLTPKNVTMYQWFKSKYKWDGDLSDFVNDCMDYFFREGIRARMEINIREEIA